MKYVIGILLGILFLLLSLIAIFICIKWTVIIGFKNKVFTVDVILFGIKKRFLPRDTKKNKVNDNKNDISNDSERTNSNDATQKTQQSKWDNIKKRIYDSENGGYKPDGIKNVIDEYKEEWQEKITLIKKLLGDMRYKIEIEQLKLIVDFGTGNPAHTGMAYGSMWNLLGFIYPILSFYFKISAPVIDITPDFYEKRLDIEFRSIIKVRPRHIIKAVFKQGFKIVLTYFDKSKRKGSVENDRK